MVKKFQNHITTIVGTLATILLSLISDFVLKLPIEVTWLTFSIGAILTITLTLLEQRLLDINSEEINRKLEIYRLLDSIEDDELLKRGHDVVEQCRTELENLSKGMLRIDTQDLFEYLIRTSRIAKHHILGTHIGFDDLHLNVNGDSPLDLQTTGEKQWYERKIELIKQGIKFERVYILPRSKATSDGLRSLKQGLKEYLEKQQNEGIEIIVVWQEDLDKPDLIQDISIFDDKVVLIIHPAWNTGYSDITVYKRNFDVEKFTNIYNSIRTKGHSLAELNKA